MLFSGKDNKKLFKEIMKELIEYKFGDSNLSCEQRVENIIKIMNKKEYKR